MPVQREWDASCPHIWDQWEQDGCTWIIQDLPPEDDDKAVELMRINQVPDENLSQICGIPDDPVATEIMCSVFKKYISARTSLACYKVESVNRILVGLNICFIEKEGEIMDTTEAKQMNNEKINDTLKSVVFMNGLYNACKYLGVDRVLAAIGLCVARDHRGFGLGARILSAREPMCRHLGVRATSTLFTGVASQKLAAKCGFTPALDLKMTQFADAGIKSFPKDDERVFKIMYKRFD